MDELHGWGPALEEIERRKAAATGMGGPARLARQAERGRLDARGRLAALFDPGTFTELGQLMGAAEDPPVNADGFVAGWGRVDGRPVLAGAEDVTVLGGSIGASSSDKRYRLCQLAAQERVPLVVLLEGAGHRVSEAGRPGRRPGDLGGMVDLSGRVPLVCLVLGASAGHGALFAPLSDYVVMTESASIFAAGPPLVRSATGEVITKEDLGGPPVAVATGGVVHDVVHDDGDAIARARRYLAHFPANAWEPPPERRGADTGRRRVDVLGLIPPDPRRPYPITPVLEEVVDDGDLFVVQAGFGASIVTALAFLGGRSVAIVANDPSVRAGTIDSDAADKAAHFLQVAGAFGLPCVFLADNPGVLAGSGAERSGILRHAARLYAVQHRLRVPKLHVTLRKAFGFGSSVMAMNPFDGQTVTLAFPSITLGALPAASDASAIDDPDERARLAREQAAASLNGAASLAYDDVIDPRDLRNALLAGLELADARYGATGPGEGILP
ncbi:acyl-CoA carboxylase subunit beta [Cryptosporangium aurantiacum]|uniref:Acetyl-CoA carboxylase, carboxyltransferase component n=1 Tax=Cryptosporangium aurantiacum TaxID=134849 RepID=A0A1M7RKK7_9ACTN|nr:carboxyl transferase domain-containing protein [Cryptosporangium aurantiacum]SHN46608.1 Acetyl-CoA carboxylase, carboxyltransferase component [Cryptosporangium aurantiacum]